MNILKEQYGYFKEYDKEEMTGDTEYHFSQFLYSVVYNEKKYMYNFLTGELIVFDIDEDENDSRDYMISHRFFVPAGFDEYDYAKRYKAFCREEYKVKEGFNNISVFTTTNCNARCFYCFENNGIRENMTIETADNAIEFMLKYRNDKPLYLTWFGGEPLVKADIIDHICSRLEDMGIEYYGDMHSNGYLFNEQLIEKAGRLWKLKTVRITIDGLNDTYKKVKNYANNDNDPLAKVLCNIDQLIGAGIHVQIRLHIDKFSLSEIGKLVDMICDRYANNPLVDAYIHLLFVRHEYNADVNEDDTRKGFLEKADEYEAKFVKNGLLKYELGTNTKIYACRSDRENVMDILPNGDLIKCRDYLKGPVIGNVNRSEGIDRSLLTEWRKRQEDTEECKNCMLYPECARLSLCKERSICDEIYKLTMLRKTANAIKYLYCET